MMISVVAAELSSDMNNSKSGCMEGEDLFAFRLYYLIYIRAHARKEKV